MRFETRTIGVFEVLSVQLVANEVFDAGRLRQETLRLVEKGSRRIVVDLGGVDYLYSDSINALVALNRRMLESSGRMGILVPHPKVYDILVRAGLENIMRLYRSEAELQSDSRELMRQSSAWTRPAELLSAASASQVISANVLSPKTPGEVRDAASASQRVPRRRVGSRVEVKSRRRGGRGLDQELPTGEFQLPPMLPALPGESTTMRTLSQDSSAFDQSPISRGTNPAPRPAPSPPAPPAEPTVFHIPENSQHDGYSTDAWLLSLTSQHDGPSPTASQMVAETAAGSSSFLPKLSGSPSGQGETNPPSQFPSELNWDESETPQTGRQPPKRGAAPGAAASAKNSQSPQQQTQPTASQLLGTPARPPKPSAPSHQSSVPPTQFANPASAPSYPDTPYASAFLDSAVSETPGSTFNPGSTASFPPFAGKTPVNDPWQPAPFQPPRQEPDIRSAIFYDQPIQTPAQPAQPSAQNPVKPNPPPTPIVAQNPAPAQRPAPPKAAPSALDSWLTAAPATAKTSATQPPPPPKPAAQKPAPSALDSWISPAPTATAKPAPSPATAPKPVSQKPEPSAIESWISPAPATPQAKAPTAAARSNTAIGGTSWLEPTKPVRKPPVAPKDPTSFLDIDDLDEQASSKKPLWIALIALAFVAIVGIVIYFSDRPKKTDVEVPSETALVDSTATAPVPTESVEVTAPLPEQDSEKPTASEAPKSSKSSKAEPKSDTKSKQKSESDKNKNRMKESQKTPPVSVAPPPPPEEEHAPVKVFVTSRPSGATLILDGSKAGTTPCEVTIKRAGRLEFNLAGYRKQTKDVDPEETRGTINVQLSSDGGNSGTGRIYISSAPIGAEIVVAGKVVGKTPKLVELPTGSQKVTVRSGVLSKTRSVDIQSGTNTPENFSL